MVPIIIVIKILEELGLIIIFSEILSPLMELIGLPGAMGLVWATAMLTNLYGGLVVFASLIVDYPLTVAQVTVISSMMLIAHALPVEARIAQKAGIRIVFTLSFRFIMAVGFAWILNEIYQLTDSLQQPLQLLWSPEVNNPSLWSWVYNQILGLLIIFGIVWALVFTLDVLKKIHVIGFISRLLRPLMHRLGIAKEAETITLAGLTLGLSYGGALLIKEVEQGHIPPRDVLYSISLLGLTHSLIEDTLLMMLIGGHLSGILFARVLFSFIVIGFFVYLVRRLELSTIRRFFIHHEISA